MRLFGGLAGKSTADLEFWRGRFTEAMSMVGNEHFEKLSTENFGVDRTLSRTAAVDLLASPRHFRIRRGISL